MRIGCLRHRNSSSASFGSCRKRVWSSPPWLRRPQPSSNNERLRVSQGWISCLVPRYRLEGDAAFEPRSRRPTTNPTRLPQAGIDLIVELRHTLTGKGLDAGSRCGIRFARSRSATVTETEFPARPLSRFGHWSGNVSSCGERPAQPRWPVLSASSSRTEEPLRVAPICRTLAEHGVPTPPADLARVGGAGSGEAGPWHAIITEVLAAAARLQEVAGCAHRQGGWPWVTALSVVLAADWRGRGLAAEVAGGRGRGRGTKICRPRYFAASKPYGAYGCPYGGPLVHLDDRHRPVATFVDAIEVDLK
jgi:hypothetical protein